MPGALLLFLEDLHHGVEIFIGLGQRGALGGDVAVVETVVGNAKLLEELEGHADAVDGVLDGVGLALPGPQHGARPEGIAARAP